MARKRNPLVERFEANLKLIYEVITSPVGLLFILILYSIIGAILFQKLEAPEEQRIKSVWSQMREEVVNKLWNYTHNKHIKKEVWKQLARTELYQFEEELLKAFGSGVTDSEPSKIVWDLWGGLFYSATVYTTVGYGNIFPLTRGGKLATIVYATIGIPLCLWVLAELGKLATKYLKTVVAKLIDVKKSIFRSKKKRKARGGEEPADEPFTVDEEFNFTLWPAVIIMVLYTLFGAWLFMQWEEWDFLDSFYFVFVTISTIGFGDILPDKPNHFLASFVYLLVGLTIVSMVFTIIMDDIVMRWDSCKDTLVKTCKAAGITIVEEVKTEKREEASPAAVQEESSDQVRRGGTEGTDLRHRTVGPSGSAVGNAADCNSPGHCDPVSSTMEEHSASKEELGIKASTPAEDDKRSPSVKAEKSGEEPESKADSSSSQEMKKDEEEEDDEPEWKKRWRSKNQ